MTLAHHYDPVFGLPSAKKARRRRKEPTGTVFRYRDPDSILACEFSNLGRDPRYPSGWYILPVLALGLLVLGFLLA